MLNVLISWIKAEPFFSTLIAIWLVALLATWVSTSRFVRKARLAGSVQRLKREMKLTEARVELSRAVRDVREIQFYKNGRPETKCVSVTKYNELMELMKDPDNGQVVRQILDSL